MVKLTIGSFLGIFIANISEIDQSPQKIITSNYTSGLLLWGGVVSVFEQ
jgi:hypothetical protein